MDKTAPLAATLAAGAFIALQCIEKCSPLLADQSSVERTIDDTLDDLGAGSFFDIDVQYGRSITTRPYTLCESDSTGTYHTIATPLDGVYEDAIRKEVYLITQQAACQGQRNTVDELYGTVYMLLD